MRQCNHCGGRGFKVESRDESGQPTMERCTKCGLMRTCGFRKTGVFEIAKMLGMTDDARTGEWKGE